MTTTTATSYGPVMKKMLAAFPSAVEKPNGWWAHPDNPTFDFREQDDGRVSIHSWTNRTQEEIMAMGGLSSSDMRHNGYYKAQNYSKIDVISLAQDKLIPWQFLFNLGLQDGYRHKGYSCLKI